MELSSELESILRETLAQTKGFTDENRLWATWERGMRWIIESGIPNGPALQQLLRDRISQMFVEEREKKKAEMQFCPIATGTILVLH